MSFFAEDVPGSGAVTATITGDVNILGDSGDMDSDAGSDPHEMFGIALPFAGGHVIGGTVANPLVVTGGGGGIQFAEDTPHVSGDLGTLLLVVRKDAPGSLSDTDGDRSVLQVDGTGRLRTAIDASVGLFTTDTQGPAAPLSGAWPVKITDGASILGILAAPIRVDPTGTTPQPISGSVSITGSVTVVQATHDSLNLNANLQVGDTDVASTNRVPVQLFDGAGDSAMDDANNALRVNVVAGGGAGGTSSVDNSAFPVGTGSVTPVMGLFDDTAPSAATEDRVAVVRMSVRRELYVQLRDASGAERGLNIDANNNLGVAQATHDNLNANVNLQVADTDVSDTNPVPVDHATITHAAPGFATVASTSTLILAANASRKYALIVNDSNQDIYLAFGTAAILNRGILINKGGGFHEITLINLDTQAINGIAVTGASNNVTVQEAT